MAEDSSENSHPEKLPRRKSGRIPSSNLSSEKPSSSKSPSNKLSAEKPSSSKSPSNKLSAEKPSSSKSPDKLSSKLSSSKPSKVSENPPPSNHSSEKPSSSKSPSNKLSAEKPSSSKSNKLSSKLSSSKPSKASENPPSSELSPEKPSCSKSSNKLSAEKPPSSESSDKTIEKRPHAKSRLEKVRCTNEMLGFKEDAYGALSIGDIVIPPPPVAALSHDVPDKRLIITKLRIKNFKSYANEIILGPFNKNFTAVVGPNGSGKSNVIDSLLFVFGYRAKKIRSKKVSHLIHKSDQHPNINSCCVAVHFAMIQDLADGSYNIIPNTEFVISRTALSDDSSFYEMNNKRTPYKEVARALRQYGIDLEHSRFLILQGEIEAISLMHPKAQNEHESGMLEYIEDIIGSNRYIEPLKQLLEINEKLNVEKNEKLNNLKLVEKEKDDLEQPKNKAIEFLRLENRLILNENAVLHFKRFAAEKELEEVTESKKEFVERLNKLKTDINEIKTSRKSQEGDLEKINRELEVNMNDFEKYKDLYKTLEREDVQMAEEIKHLKTKKSKIETNLSSTKSELEKLKKKFETHESETAELNKMKEKLDSDKSMEDKKLSEVMDSLQSETNLLQEKKDKLEAELLKKQTQVYGLKSEMDLLESELNIHLRADKKEKQTLSALISSYEVDKISSEEEKLLLEKEQNEIGTVIAELNSVNEQIEQSKQRENKLSNEFKNACLRYEEAKNSLTAFKNQSGMLQAFAKEKASGRLKGVYGRLGDLGAIDEKYDIAISTACGQLDNIVTDTLATAQKCVEFLKKNNLGYATFIPLDKMTTWIPYAQNKIVTPENVPRLFDLVHVKDVNVLPAFYYALKDTLVANNLEQATRIGLQGSKRYRVVTLKGELIDLAGTMSGGGGRISKGRMGQTVVECTHTPEDVEKIRKEKEIASKAVTDIRQLILDLHGQISTKTKRHSNLKLSVKKRESNYKAYLDRIDMLQIQIEEQKKKMETTFVDEEKMTDLRNKIAQKQKGYEASAKDAHAVEEKVLKLQEEILKITKGSFSKAKKNVEQLAKKATDLSQSITKSLVNTKACKRNIKKAEEKIKNFEKDLEAAICKKTKLDANREISVGKAKEYIVIQEKAQAAIDELKGKKNELKIHLKTFDEEEQKLKLDEINEKNRLKELQAVESEKQSSIKNYIAKMSKLKLNEVENDSTEIPTLSPDEIQKLSVKRILSDSDLLKVQLEEMKPNLSTIAEFKKKQKVCDEKQKELDVISREKDLQQWRCDEIKNRRLTEFMRGFTAIAQKLKETYQMLTLGGDAEMELKNSSDAFDQGIEFNVRPPKKSWKYMRNLSGGEKTLSSLSLVLALHYYRPTPFYVMDEIDAALDERNVAIVAYYLKERTKNTQFIIVSLRNTMNELSDHLIGIYKTNNCSKNVSLRMAFKWKEEDEAEAAVNQA